MPDATTAKESPRKNPAETISRSNRFSRFMRGCAGIDEDVLKTASSERHRYVGVGGIVLGTAVLTSASMTLAISLIVEDFKIYHLIVPIIWGLFIFNLDRWLVTSTHGTGSRFTLLPRVGIAVLFGFIIAEPVVLWVFGDAIEAHIASERKEQLDNEIDLLVRCNPEESTNAEAARASAECEGFLLRVDVPATNERATTLETKVASLEEDIKQLDAQISEASGRLQREVRGEPGQDTSGRAGEGPIVRNIREELDSATTRRATLETERASLDEELKLLQQSSGSSEQSYAETIRIGRAERIEALEQQLSTKPGLLLRFEALADLANESFHIFAATWFMRAFLIMIDTMPVVAKAISSKSSYDKVLGNLQETAVERERLKKSEETEIYKQELNLRKIRRDTDHSVAVRKINSNKEDQIFEIKDKATRQRPKAHASRRQQTSNSNETTQPKPRRPSSVNGANKQRPDSEQRSGSDVFWDDTIRQKSRPDNEPDDIQWATDLDL